MFYAPVGLKGPKGSGFETPTGLKGPKGSGFETPTGLKGPKGEGFERPTGLNFTNVPSADAAKVNISSAKTSTIKIFCRKPINSNVFAYVGMSFVLQFFPPPEGRGEKI